MNTAPGNDIATATSPRVRGTHLAEAGQQRGVRAIPARAGNARRLRPDLRMGPGHPRAGGERYPGAEDTYGDAGPSPRGRGTQERTAWREYADRAIPARAGNAEPRGGLRGARPGHPRAGGERADDNAVELDTLGPSPRGRGTRVVRCGRRQPHRAIPARAGNAGGGPRAPSATPGHPRAGGERSPPPGSDPDNAGPSPRGRGTHAPCSARASRLRAIPARAGNAARCASHACQSPGHPRAGGERLSAHCDKGGQVGPSPRGRGTGQFKEGRILR